MTATTSGTTSFNLDVDDIIEQALSAFDDEDWVSGVDMIKARRTLNLVLIQLQNKRIPLNKINTEDQSLTVAGGREYTLDSSIVDVLELNIYDPADSSNPELNVDRIGLREYHQIPNKGTSNRPTTFAVERGNTTATLKVWPTPDQTYTAKMLVSKRVEDVTAAYEKVDLPYRYLPLLIKWLSYELALTSPKVSLDKINLLQLELNRVMPDTFDEDGERVDFFVRPGGISGK